MNDQDNRVLVVDCPEYDVGKIKEIVSQGMQTLGYQPQGKIALKPNVVCAFHPQVWEPSTVTSLEVMEGTIRALADKGEVSKISVTETSAIGNPTRFSFHWSGYRARIGKLAGEVNKPLELKGMDEEKRVSVFIGGKVHDRVRLGKTFAEADSKIYVPKLKCHCVSKMTGTVKLNVGIVSFDDRSIRHDFLLNEKIADLAAVGWPDFVVMDAITIGVGNEAFPTPRHLGLILMGRNALAVDLVAARLLGMNGATEVPYLAEIVSRGYQPSSLDQIQLGGDAKSVSDLDRFAERVKPYDDEFYRWQDVNKEFERMKSPLRLLHGPYSDASPATCDTGCVMGIKMYLGFLEKYAGAGAFAQAHPGLFIIGKIKEPVDAAGKNIFIFGNCSRAELKNPRRVMRINNCFVTASDMMLMIGNRLGIKSPVLDPKFFFTYLSKILAGMTVKTFNGRYLQDAGYYLSNQLFRKI